MKSNLIPCGAVSLRVVVLLSLTSSTHCSIWPSLIWPSSIWSSSIWAIKPTHNLTMGQRQPNDKLIYDQTIRKNASQRYNVYQYVHWPLDYSQEIHNITMVRAENKGDEGYVVFQSGGIGKSYVELYFESSKYNKFQFDVTIYGYPSQNDL